MLYQEVLVNLIIIIQIQQLIYILESVNGYLIQEYNPTIGNNNELSAIITGIYSAKNETSSSKIFYYTKSN